MEPIKISVEVNLNISDDAKSFLSSIFSNVLSNVNVSTEKTEALPVTKQTITGTLKTTKQPEVAKQPEQTQEQSSEEDSDITIEMLREVLAEKVNNNRVAIKDKLVYFGAKSITTLDKSSYSEMFDFLNSLK
jgi:hypothetical protein